MTKIEEVDHSADGVRTRPKVFGVGLMKTGTKTLSQCMRLLNYDHCSYNKECLLLLLDGEKQSITKLFHHYDSFDDWPWPSLYREADAMFPDAKFILTVRESEDVWYTSLLRHYDRGKYNGLPSQKRIYKGIFGYENPHENKEAFVRVYSDHNRKVREYFSGKPGKFLEISWERGDGWAEVCSFLGDDIPKLPLPHANKGTKQKTHNQSQITRKLTRKMRALFKTEDEMRN